jgi:GPI mannosyltransferase 3
MQFQRSSQNLFLVWWLFAILIRLLASMTHSHWFHPDEWCQTLEPANLIAHGFGYHSQETGLHLRNLSWPFLLAGVLKSTQALLPNSIQLRIFGVNFLCGFLDLFILWAWIQLSRQESVFRNCSNRVKNAGLALLLLPWFTVYKSVSPRGEHLSEIAFWAALGFMAHEYWIVSGIASVAVLAFRYPSALFSLGLFLGLGIRCFKNKNYRPLIRHSAGIAIGLIIFGIPDALFYGRPWESFWMYLQYNIFSGASSQFFGKQGISEYAELFRWNWTTYPILIPLAVTLFGLAIVGFFQGLKRIQTWALCLLIYLIGHFLVPHKEGRFMVPIETLVYWSAFVGLAFLSNKVKQTKALRISIASVLGISLLANSLIFLHALRADLWRDRGTYRELRGHLLPTKSVCAVLTGYEAFSVHLPFQPSTPIPEPAVGTFITENNRAGYPAIKTSKIGWIEHAPQCSATDSVLLHVHKAEKAWTQHSCTLLASGILRILPQRSWTWAVERKLVSGAWYQCPSDVLKQFKGEEVLQVMSRSFGRMSSLPRIGITAQELEKLGRETSPPPEHSSAWKLKPVRPET